MKIPFKSKTPIQQNTQMTRENRWLIIIAVIVLATMIYVTKDNQDKKIEECQTILYEHLYERPDPLKENK